MSCNAFTGQKPEDLRSVYKTTITDGCKRYEGRGNTSEESQAKASRGLENSREGSTSEESVVGSPESTFPVGTSPSTGCSSGSSYDSYSRSSVSSSSRTSPFLKFLFGMVIIGTSAWCVIDNNTKNQIIRPITDIVETFGRAINSLEDKVTIRTTGSGLEEVKEEKYSVNSRVTIGTTGSGLEEVKEDNNFVNSGGIYQKQRETKGRLDSNIRKKRSKPTSNVVRKSEKPFKVSPLDTKTNDFEYTTLEQNPPDNNIVQYYGPIRVCVNGKCQDEEGAKPKVVCENGGCIYYGGATVKIR